MNNIKLEDLLKMLKCEENKNILKDMYGSTPRKILVKPIMSRRPIPVGVILESHKKNRFKKKQ
jgi:hypothetical protein